MGLGVPVVAEARTLTELLPLLWSTHGVKMSTELQ
jgi:hypothetical protein